MAGPNTIQLAAEAQAEGLQSVLVGGNAVNLYAYRRTTFDVDLLVREDDRKRWTSFFEQRGYVVFHATTNFVRMRFGADPTGALPVDLMLADEDTFRKISAQSQQRDIGEGIHFAIPSPLHLIAMKLHALRSAQRVAHGADLEDVRHLIKAEKIDISSADFRHILDVMPPNQSKPQFSETSENPLLNRDAGMSELPAFPLFDSIPATAGLTNLEAFRLSLRHALTLLPLVSAKSLAAWDPADEPERFTIR